MRILVLGATGMLGYQIFKTCVSWNITVHAVVRNNKLLVDNMGAEIESKISIIDDVKNLPAIEDVIKIFKPDYLVNCVGIIKQSELAEDHYESVSINSLLPHQLERLGNVYDFRLVHISTDCVFNGRKGKYLDTDISDAYDLYGRSKFLGEVNYGNGITLRTSIIGHEIAAKKHGLVDWFLSQSGTVKGYTKAIFSGVTTLELTRIILDVIIAKKVPAGLYQVASEPIAKADLLKMVADIYHKSVTIVPSEEVAIDRSLIASDFYQLTSYTPPSWKAMIEEMHNDFQNNKQ